MKLLLLLMTLPFLGGIALAVDHYARYSATRDEQATLTSALRILACGIAAVGLVLIADVASTIALTAGRVPAVTMLANGGMLLVGVIAAVGGVLAEWAIRPRDAGAAAQRSRIEGNLAIFRLCCWTFALAPLLGFFPPVVVLAPTLLVIYLSWNGVGRRSLEAALLARLATAATHQLPLVEEVQSTAIGASGRRRDALFGLADRLRDGRSLADSLEVGSRLVPRSAIMAIRAADDSDVTPRVLRQQADRSLSELEDIVRPTSSMLFQSYIASVIMILTSIMLFLWWKDVIPKHKVVYNDFGIEIPWPTKLLFAASDHPAETWFLSGPFFLLPVGLLMIPPLVRLIGWENLNLPLLMRWFPRRDGAAVLRALAAAVEAGRPLSEAVAILAEHHHRDDLRDRLKRVAAALDQGESPWNVLNREGLIGRADAKALDAAMRAGDLAWGLNSMADVLDHRQNVRSAWWLEWQRPILMAIVGGAVAFAAIALFLPLIRVFEVLDQRIS
jgi:type II secretory pathway component PulF